MKTAVKTNCLVTVAVLILTTWVHSGETKPFKGKLMNPASQPFPLEEINDPFLLEMMAIFGLPDQVGEWSSDEILNAGGNALNLWIQIDYFSDDLSQILYYATGITIMANGDYYSYNAEGVVATDSWINEFEVFIPAKEVLNTGRFEGAAGWCKGKGPDKHGAYPFEGWITTVGSTMKEPKD